MSIIKKESSSNQIFLIENLALGKESEKKIFKQFVETSSSTFSDININSKYFKKKFQLLNKKKNMDFLRKNKFN